MGEARTWLRGKVAGIGTTEEIDAAGNQWFTLARRLRAGAPARRPYRLGAERRLARRLPERAGGRRGAAPHRRGRAAAAHGAARELGRRGGRALRPLALRLVGGRRLDGRPGGAAPAQRRGRHHASGRARASTASTSTGALEARSQLENAAAYLELHIEQGPVLESLDLPLGVVLGTFGVERHQVTWKGQAAHAGSTPMDKRRDALAGAAKLALEIRPDRGRGRGGRRLHIGRRRLQAGNRHVGRGDGRAAARPAAPERGLARAPALACEGGERALRARRRTSRCRGSASGRSSRSSSTTG